MTAAPRIELADRDTSQRPTAGPVPKEALDYFRRKGLRPAFRYDEVWQQEHRLAFTVAKLMETDILGKVRDSLETALKDGVPFEEWQKGVTPMFNESGWSAYGGEKNGETGEVQPRPSRLRLIYETNMRVARANGQWDRIQRTKAFLPYLVYELGPSKEHRAEHAAWAGLTLKVDDPFWQEHSPPNGYNCKCRIRQVTRTEAEADGGPDTAPHEERVPYELPDGRTGTAPAGVDPSFAYPMSFRGREEALGGALDAADEKASVDSSRPPQRSGDFRDARAIAAALTQGARRKLAELVDLCPTDLDSTGVSKFPGDEKTARKFLHGELAQHGLIGHRDARQRLGLYPTPLARSVHALLVGR